MEEVMSKITEEVIEDIENKDIKQIIIEQRKPRTIGRTNQSMWHLPASHHRDGDSLQTPSQNFALW